MNAKKSKKVQNYKKKPRGKKVNNFVRFENLGDSVSGTFQGFFGGQYGLNMKILTRNGIEKMVAIVTANLKTKLKNVASKMQIGDTIAITYIENVESKSTHQDVKIYTVVWNGKELKSGYQPVDIDELNNYFND